MAHRSVAHAALPVTISQAGCPPTCPLGGTPSTRRCTSTRPCCGEHRAPENKHQQKHRLRSDFSAGNVPWDVRYCLDDFDPNKLRDASHSLPDFPAQRDGRFEHGTCIHSGGMQFWDIHRTSTTSLGVGEGASEAHVGWCRNHWLSHP